MVNIANDFRQIDTVEVVGSNPIVPTILNKILGLNIIWPFFICFGKNFKILI